MYVESCVSTSRPMRGIRRHGWRSSMLTPDLGWRARRGREIGVRVVGASSSSARKNDQLSVRFTNRTNLLHIAFLRQHLRARIVSCIQRREAFRNVHIVDNDFAGNIQINVFEQLPAKSLHIGFFYYRKFTRQIQCRGIKHTPIVKPDHEMFHEKCKKKRRVARLLHIGFLLQKFSSFVISSCMERREAASDLNFESIWQVTQTFFWFWSLARVETILQKKVNFHQRYTSKNLPSELLLTSTTMFFLLKAALNHFPRPRLDAKKVLNRSVRSRYCKTCSKRIYYTALQT